MRWHEQYDLPKQFAERCPPLIVEVLVAIAITAFSMAIRSAIALFVTGTVLFPLAFPAIAVATVFAGVRCGLFVIILYQVVVYLFLMPSKAGFFTGTMSDYINLMLIVSAQVILLWFVAIYCKYAERTANLERERAVELQLSREALVRQQELELQLRAQNQALHETQQHLQAIYQASGEGVTLCRAIRSADGNLVDYQVLETNPAHFTLTGGPRDRMLTLPVSQIAPPVDPRWFTTADLALKTGEMQQFDVYSRATRRWLNIRVSPISDDLFQQTFVDVSDRHLLDEQRQSLLKEMSHRVLNNFQMIASFLHLQSAGASTEVKQQLDIAKNRIQVIAKLHALLAYSTSETEVDAGSYLKELCLYLSETINRPEAIRLVCDCPPTHLNADAVVPLGLITSELVMNAIKYAFPEPMGGTITVAFSGNDAEGWRLDIADDGIGLPVAKAGESVASHRGGLGTRLVQIFVRQLKGEFVTTSNGGVRHVLTFRH